MTKKQPPTDRAVALKLLRGRTPEELRFSFRLLDAMRSLLSAEAEVDRVRERMTNDRRDQIAARLYPKACAKWMMAHEKVEAICDEIRLSEKLLAEGELS